MNLDKYGNTSAASIPIALTEAQAQGRLPRGAVVVTVGFGAGLTWAANVIRWNLGLLASWSFLFVRLKALAHG